MGHVSRMVDYRERFSTPTLVLVDLHDDVQRDGQAEPDPDQLSAALETCRMVLVYARRQNLPVAFVRHSPLRSFQAGHNYPSWASGIAPGRSDMVFERTLPSCYASSEFAQMAARSSELVLAGLFGETACLSTLIETRERNHHVTYLTDASCSRGRDAASARKMHQIVTELASLYSRPCTARDWMEQLSVRAGVAR